MQVHSVLLSRYAYTHRFTNRSRQSRSNTTANRCFSSSSQHHTETTVQSFSRESLCRFNDRKIKRAKYTCMLNFLVGERTQ